MGQGLDLDSTGRALSKPHFMARERFVAEQEGWASQSDKKTSEFLDNMQLRGGQAFHNAGALGFRRIRVARSALPRHCSSFGEESDRMIAASCAVHWSRMYRARGVVQLAHMSLSPGV